MEKNGNKCEASERLHERAEELFKEAIQIRKKKSAAYFREAKADQVAMDGARCKELAYGGVVRLWKGDWAGDEIAKQFEMSICHIIRMRPKGELATWSILDGCQYADTNVAGEASCPCDCEAKRRE